MASILASFYSLVTLAFSYPMIGHGTRSVAEVLPVATAATLLHWSLACGFAALVIRLVCGGSWEDDEYPGYAYPIGGALLLAAFAGIIWSARILPGESSVAMTIAVMPFVAMCVSGVMASWIARGDSRTMNWGAFGLSFIVSALWMSAIFA